MSERNGAVRAMIRQLQDAFNQTLDALYDLPEGYLQQPCGHSCARGGSARDLLVHNVFHEKQHTGQVWNIRDELRLLQGWGNATSCACCRAGATRDWIRSLSTTTSRVRS